MWVAAVLVSGREEVGVRSMNRDLGGQKGGGRSLCWPAESADGDIKGTKSFSQMVQKPIFSSKERGEQNSAIR